MLCEAHSVSPPLQHGLYLGIIVSIMVFGCARRVKTEPLIQERVPAGEPLRGNVIQERVPAREPLQQEYQHPFSGHVRDQVAPGWTPPAPLAGRDHGGPPAGEPLQQEYQHPFSGNVNQEQVPAREPLQQEYQHPERVPAGEPIQQEYQHPFSGNVLKNITVFTTGDDAGSGPPILKNGSFGFTRPWLDPCDMLARQGFIQARVWVVSGRFK